MISWAEFEVRSADIARAGIELLYHPGRGEVAILATVDPLGRPRVAPVSPIFCDAGLYLSLGAHTPKYRHLRRDPHYALHAMVGADDLEFQISGLVRWVESVSERNAVVAAIPFPSFDASDPIVELLIDRALMVTWPQRTARGVKTAWQADT